MAAVSLEKDKKLLVSTLGKLKSAKVRAAFIEDLLTEEEILDFAQRIKIAQLILGGKTYDEISTKVGASTSTVSKIGQIIKYGKGGFSKTFVKKKVLNKS